MFVSQFRRVSTLMLLFCLPVFALSPERKMVQLPSNVPADPPSHSMARIADAPLPSLPAGNPWANIASVRALGVNTNNYGTPLSLAAADMNHDGIPDLICAYGNGQNTRIVVYLANERAIYSHKPAAGLFQGNPRSFELSVSPDRIAAGDFDADGNEDLAVAPNGSDTLYWLSGDGKGGFSAVHTLQVGGIITALAVGDVNRADLLPDILLGTSGKEGFQLQVFESPLGALRGTPEKTPMPDRVNSIAVGQLDDSFERDIAVASGSNVMVIHGRDRKLSSTLKSRQSVLPAGVDTISLDSSIESLSLGNFEGDSTTKIATLSSNGVLRLLERSGSGWTSKVVEGGFAGVSSLSTAQISGGSHQNLLLSGGAVRALNSAGGALSAATLSTGATAVQPMRLNNGALDDLVLIRSDSHMLSIAPSAPAATFVVNTTADTADAVINGVCDDGTGQCSLRAAIQEANATGALDAITFNIPGTGPFNIILGSALPPITAPVTIDATTQPGASTTAWPATLMIHLNASAATNPVWIQAGGSGTTIRGFVINHSQTFGVLISASSNNVVAYNYIGTDIAGNAAAANTYGGIDVETASSNNRIGGTTPADRNLISGNGNSWAGILIGFGSPITGTTIEGNYIGTNAAGTAAVPNGGNGGILVVSNVAGTTIGGASAGARNLISGNQNSGIYLPSGSVSGTIVAGNYIGSDASGTAAVGNTGTGIFITGDSVTVGGTAPGSRNVILGNQFNDMQPQGSSAFNLNIQGNYIGVDATGTAGFPSPQNCQLSLIFTGPGNLVGGTVPLARNVISGAASGSNCQASNYYSAPAEFYGNYIGTDAAGMASIPNYAHGLLVLGSPGTIVGSSDPGARNILTGNGGIGLYSDSQVTIEGNYVGLNAMGTGYIPNGDEGVRLNPGSDGSLITNNVISGNFGHGGLYLAGSNNDTVTGNKIGTTADGTGPAPNTDGIWADGTGEIIGGVGDAANLIAFNSLQGITSASPTAVFFASGNSIKENGALGIDLGGDGVTQNDACDADSGPNGLQNHPVISSVTVAGSSIQITGTLNSVASTQYVLDFYANSACDSSGHGEGERYLGSSSIATDASCHASFTSTLASSLSPGELLAATATNWLTGTSEFSACVCYMPPVTAASNAPLCAGGTLQLGATDVPGATYAWTGPNGFTSNLQNPVISGAVPADSGLYTVTVAVNGCQTTASTNVTVNPPVYLVAQMLPDGTINAPYHHAFTAIGGTAPDSFAVTAGALPDGLTMNATGHISGAPTTTGTFNIVVTVTDSAGCNDSQSFQITIVCDTIAVSPATLPNPVPGTPYSATITASGGLPPYTFSVSSGSLPTGLGLDASSGDITGTPTTSGSFSFTITVMDAAGCTGSRDYVLSGCLFCDDFNDGILNTSWTYPVGTWTETGGMLVGTPATKKALAIASPIFAGCSVCSFEAGMQTAGGTGNTLSLFGWYADASNNVQVLIKQELHKIVLKQKAGGVTVAKKAGNVTVNPNVTYKVRVTYDGTNFLLSVDGVQIFTLPAVGIPNGTLGLGSAATAGSYDYVLVN